MGTTVVPSLLFPFHFKIYLFVKVSSRTKVKFQQGGKNLAFPATLVQNFRKVGLGSYFLIPLTLIFLVFHLLILATFQGVQSLLALGKLHLSTASSGFH